LLAEIGAVLRGESAESLVVVVDARDTGQRAPLQHEEPVGLPLIDDVLSGEQWATFGMSSGARVAHDAPRFVPWMVSASADPEAFVTRLPPPFQQGYRGWADEYATLNVWPS
jgi:hypothetical protein